MAELGTKTDAETEFLPVRQRSNSDPKPSVEPLSSQSGNKDGSGGDNTTFYMSGCATTPRPVKHLKDDSRRNGENKTTPGGASNGTPPTERKSKLSTLGRIFRPWKWKRKKKSEKIEKAAVEIERKISMRTSREELIRKGVIKEPEGSHNHFPKIEMLKECDEEQANSSGPSPAVDPQGNQIHPARTPNPNGSSGTPEDKNVTSDMSVPPPMHHTEHPSTLPSQPVAMISSPSSSSPSHPSSQTHPDLSTCVQLPSAGVSSSSTHARPVIIPPGPQQNPREHPPPPNYNEAVSQVASEMRMGGNSIPYSFQPGMEGMKRVAIVAPQEIHSDHEDDKDDDDDDEDDDDDGNKYVTNPSLVHPQSPYEAVLASEPDLTRLPQKSALKKKNHPSPAASSWSTRPLDTSRASPTTRFAEPTAAHPSPPPSGTPPVGTVRPIPRPRVTLQTQVTGDNESDKENIPKEPNTQPDHHLTDSDDSEDEEIKYKDDYDPNSLAAKVARNDSLARFLDNRPSKTELLAKNIIPTQTDTEKKELREAIGSKLTRRLSLRPTQEELENRNILHQQSSDEHLAEKERKRRYLIRKLSFRPSIEELRERKIIDFSDYVEVTDAHEYDRRAEKPWTKLTPRDKAAIRKELNEFKSKEMDVHQESRHLTRFHKP